MKTTQNTYSGRLSFITPSGIVLFIMMLFGIIGGQKSYGQGVGISEVSITPQASSILELQSTLRGFLAPRMLTTERTAIVSPAQGLLVYDTNTKSFWYFDGTWKAVAATGLGTSNQLLGMNNPGDANEYKTLFGTTNRISVTHALGSITLTTPQDIHQGASPTFFGLTVSGLTANSGVYTNGTSTLTATPPTTGILGYWSRLGTILSPTNAGDAVTTSGNIYTTGTGTITSAGLLTGSTGATLSGAAVNLNSSSNFVTNINSGTSTGNVTIGNALSSLYLPKFTTPGILHNNGSGLISSSQISLTGDVINILPVPSGGTGVSTLTNHGVIIGQGTNPVSTTATGTAGQVLQSRGSGADPSYSTAIYPTTTTINQLLYSSSNDNITGLTTGSNGVLVTDAGGVPSISSLLPDAVQYNITKLGTITNGTWNGTIVDLSHGGTNTDLSGGIAVGDLLYGTATGFARLADAVTGNVLISGGAGVAPSWSKVGLTTHVSGVLQALNGGTGYDNTYTNGQLLIGNSSGTLTRNTLTGIANQIYVTNGDGSITLSTPQDIHSGAAPTFLGLTLSGLTANSGVYTDGSKALTSTPPLTGTLGYWNRTGTVLSPTTAGDDVTTSGNISATGTGTITSAGLLTGSSGASLTGGTVNINNSSNFATNINTGTSSGNVTIGNILSSLYLPKFTTPGILHNDNAGLISSSLLSLTTDISGILPVLNGGTGLPTFGGINTVLYTSAADVLTSVATSTASGQFLQTTTAGSAPTWKMVLDVANGGLGQSSPLIPGGVLYGSTATAAGVTAAGLTGQMLRSTGVGTPIWSTPTYPNSATLGKIMRGDGTNWLETATTYPNSTTINQLLYSPSDNTIAGLPTLNNGVLVTNGTGVPQWANRTDFTSSALTDGHIYVGNASDVATDVAMIGDATIINSGAVTVGRINGATVPLSGALTTGNVLQVSGLNSLMYGPVNVSGGTDYVTGTLPVDNGGTGIADITTNNLIYGNGTSPVSLLAPSGTTGALLTTTVTGAPGWLTLNALPTTSGILPIANGGTNSGVALTNGRVMVSRDGKIVEAGTMNNGQVIVGSDGLEPQIVTMGGDITIDNSGATTIGAGRVQNGMLATGIDANKIGAGTVDNTEFGYLNGVSSSVQTQFNNLQSELDVTEAGAGLTATGSYIVDGTTTYLTSATNLANAEKLLDTQVKLNADNIATGNTDLTNLQTEVNTIETGAGLNADGSYTANAAGNYISTAGSLQDADNKIDARLKTTNDDLTTEVSRAQAAETTLTTNLAGEVTRATAAEGVLSTNLTTEITNRTNGDATLTTNLNTETTNRTNADAALQTELNTTQAGAGLTATGSYIVDGTTTYLTSATSLANAEKLLDTQVKLNADNIATGNTDLTNLQTEVNTIETGAGLNADGSYTANAAGNYISMAGSLQDADNKIDARLKTTNDDLTTEVSRAQAAETTLTTNLAGEVTRATAAEGVLSTNLTTEVTNRINGDATLTTNLTTEVTNRTNADAAIQTELNTTQAGAGLTATGSYIVDGTTTYLTSATSLANADKLLDTQVKLNADNIATSNTDLTNLQTEVDAIETGSGLNTDGSYAANGAANYITGATSLAVADNMLDGQLKTTTDDLTSEVTRATTAEGVISGNLASEITRATGAEGTLTANLATEVTNRINGDATLTTNLTTEVTNRTNADAAIQTELNTTQAGAGLNADGTYTANGAANYISTATSLKVADNLLDAQVKLNTDAIATSNTDLTNLQTEVDAIETGSGLNADGTYTANGAANYISTATGLKSADNLLDAQLKTTNDDLTSEVTRATTAEGVISGNLTSEITRATAAEGTLTTNLATEVTNRTNGDATLTTNLTTEVTNRTNADAGIQTELNTTQAGAGLTATGSYIVDGTTTYLTTATSLANADKLLDTQVKLNADNIATGNTDLTNLQTEVNTIETGAGLNADGSYTANAAGNYISTAGSLQDADNKIDARLKTTNDDLTTEVTRATTAEGVISGNLTSEITRATAAEGTLTTNLATEVTNRTNGDATLTTNLATEVTNRTNADAGIQTELNTTQAGAGLNADGTYTANGTANYISTATSLKVADNLLDAQVKLNTDNIATGNTDLTNLQTEVNTIETGAGLNTDGSYAANGAANYISGATSLTVADNMLDGQLKTTTDDLTSEVTRATTAEGVISGNLTSEITRATAAEGTLTTNLATEVTNRTNGDATLTTNLTTEVTNRTNADAGIQTELNTTQAGAGLTATGSYIVDGTTTYLTTATSLANADKLLDTQVKLNTDNIALKANISGQVFTGAISATNLSGINTGDQTLVGLGGVPTSRNLTINGTTQDLSADRTFTITNITGNAGTVTTNANLTGPITSVGNATAIASQTGTGTKFVMDTSPTLITPILGAATATSITATGIVSGSQLTSTIATGTSPLVVTSTTPVANLSIGGNAATATTAATVTTNANLTGMVTSIGNATTVVTNANLTGPITSIGNATSVALQTGTGSTFVMNTSPTLVTPNLGVASATSLSATGTVSGNQLTSTVATGTAPLAVTSTTPVGNLNIGGNAATATKLLTARNINGVAFDGSADITLPTVNIAGGTLGDIPYQTAPNTTGLLAATTTANRVLMSGASAAPSWSIPTFPNISATTRKIIISDGTNWTASTETYAVPGAIGNLLVSDGTNWTSALPTFNQNTTGSAATWTTARSLAGNSVNGSANVNFTNKFIVQGTVDAGLPNAQFLGGLSNGLLKNTTTTGVLSIASAGTDYAPPTTGTSFLTGNGSGGFTNVGSTGTGNVVLANTPTLITPNIGAATGTSLVVTGKISSSGTAGIGYASGAGGTVTQLTNKSTSVSIDKICGMITTDNSTLNNFNSVSFTVYNTLVSVTDVPVVAFSGGTTRSYIITVTAVANSSFEITIFNNSGLNLSNVLYINYVIIKAVSI